MVGQSPIVITDAGSIAKVQNYYTGLSKRLPRALDKTAWNIAQMLGKELQNSKQQVGIQDWTGKLRASLKTPRKNSDKEYVISMPWYAMALDKGIPHTVLLRDIAGDPRKQSLVDWFQSKGVSSFELPIKPHVRAGSTYAFIDRGIERTRQRLRDEVLNSPVMKTIKKRR